MGEQAKKQDYIPVVMIFFGLPLLLWALSDFPRRTVLKESLSVLTLLAFCLILGEFFLTRSGRNFLKVNNLGKAIKIHKFIGYPVVLIILVHPFLIVVPRYFESGVAPMEAFKTIITTFESFGVVLGIIAWCLMLILAVTSLFRKKLPMKYQTWRMCHGILSILFISTATWHAVDLGRHMNRPISIYMIILATIGGLLVLKAYVVNSLSKKEDK